MEDQQKRDGRRSHHLGDCLREHLDQRIRDQNAQRGVWLVLRGPSQRPHWRVSYRKTVPAFVAAKATHLESQTLNRGPCAVPRDARFWVKFVTGGADLASISGPDEARIPKIAN